MQAENLIMSLKEDFDKNLKPKLQSDLGLSSVFAVPQIDKIVINMGVGKMRDNKNFIEEAMREMAAISGQHPSQRLAKTSISNFKLRKGQLTGIAVTLRGQKMWDFYEKLVRIVLPRVKDFRGVKPKSFDGAGNYNLGFEEHIVFPEIDPNGVTYTKPLQVTISTTAKNDELGHKLLELLGMPFIVKKK